MIDHLFISKVDVPLDDGFGNMFGHVSFSLELKIFDQSRVLVHGEDNVSHGFERSGQELGDIELTILVDACFIAGTIVGCISQNLIDVFMLVWIAL